MQFFLSLIFISCAAIVVAYLIRSHNVSYNNAFDLGSNVDAEWCQCRERNLGANSFEPSDAALG